MLQQAEPPPTASEERAAAAGTPLSSAAQGAPIGTAEKLCAAALFLVLLALRIVCAQHYRVDSDEPQHLHVVWGWANGLLQYKEIFDNHSPLFQMLCAPVFRLFGERADIIIPMRHAMLPIFAFNLWCVYKIASRLGTKRLALWTTVAVGFAPIFFLVSTEFRTDDLWAALWLLAVMLATGGEFKGWRAFWIGLVFGAAFAVSMKSSILIVSLLLASGTVWLLRVRGGEPVDRAQLARSFGLALLGLLVVPGLLIAFFAWKHALPEMYYCVIKHNALIGGNKLKKLSIKRFLFPMVLLAAPFITQGIIRLRSDRPAAYRQAIILLAALFYGAALKSFWPLITDQDYLPRDPLLILAAAPAFAWIVRQRAPWTYGLTGAVIACELTVLLRMGRPWHDDATNKIQEIAEVLRITNRDDYVMDGKGEFIFRNRPYYFVLEGVSIALMKRHLITDNIIQRLIDTRTCVVLRPRLPKADAEFVEDNYLFDRQKIGVAGKQLGTTAPVMSFSTVIPARYTVVAQRGTIFGTLDGKPLQASQFLEPGEHRLELKGSKCLVAVVWSQAIERGYTVRWKYN